MKRLAILLFISSSVISGTQSDSDSDHITFTGRGVTIDEALVRAVCAFSMSANVSVYRSQPLSLDSVTKKVDGVYATFTEMTSEYGHISDDLSIKIKCTETVTSICIDDKDHCQGNEQITSKRNYFNIERVSTESSGTITYLEKIIVAPGDDVLLDVNMLKHPVEEKHCDMNCMIMSLHNVGVSVSDLDVTGDKRPGISLSVSLDQANFSKASDNRKNLWQQYKTQKGQEELAAAIANMPVQQPTHTSSYKKDNQRIQSDYKSEKAIEELRRDLKSLEKDAAKKFDYL